MGGKTSCTALLVVLLVTSCFPANTAAQTNPAHVIGGTVSVSEQTRIHLDAWLAVSPPSATALYYAPTYLQPEPEDGFEYVSLAGLVLSTPEEPWLLENDEQVVWIGTVKVYEDGTVELFSGQQAHASHLARPARAGGGSHIAFPWQSGAGVVYGARGVHGNGDYGTSGMVAVDFVSGSGLGSNAASDGVFAANAGTIDYVCDDGTSVAIRTNGGGEYFVYAHLLPNATLSIGQSYAQKGSIGTLKHGSFDDSCGWAEQAPTNYHLHFMFAPSNNAYQLEDCVLTLSDKKWHCGSDNPIGTGQWLISSGTYSGSTGLDDPSTSAMEGSLWDYIIIAVAFIIDPFFQVTPDHQGLNFVYAIQNSITLLLKIAIVFFYGNVNLTYFATALAFIMAAKFLQFALWLVAFMFKAWKSLVPIIGA